ncbi:MAG: FecR domain-containing protein, partial [Candidatus Aminicenantes bacterium]|nr:FecR domain-containing protein [Candidatus Aminicenantes bacterium]
MKKLTILALAAVAAFPFLAFGQTDGYYDRSFIRLSYVKGDVYIQRAQDLGYEQGEVNLVVVAGDKLGTRDGRAEIQLGRGNVLRLDANTQVDVAGLPSRDGDPTKIHLLNGSVYFRVRELDLEKNIQVHTPDASFYILEPGLFRVDVRDNRRSELSVYSGGVEAAGEGGSVLVRAGETVAAQDGRLTGEPTGLLARRDDFDSWNETRDGLYARKLGQTYLPSEYSDYDYELSEYGDWSYESDYGYVWVPRVYDTGWRPYYHGRWTWYPIIGWTWVSYEPWGWCTSHYGRWGWRFGLGWYWIPMSRWSWGPAWVHWYNHYDYIGWCPLSYWGYPAVIVNNVFYGRHSNGWYDAGDYRSYARSLTVVRRDQLQNRRLSDIALNDRSGAKFGRITMRQAQPNLRPAMNLDLDVINRARIVLDRNSLRPVGRDFSSRTADRPNQGLNGLRPSRDGAALQPNPGARASESPARNATGAIRSNPGNDASRSTTPSRTIRERATATAPSRSATPSSRVSTPARSSTPTVRSNSGNDASRSSSTSRTIRERGTATAPSRSQTPSSRVSTPARSSTTTVRSNPGNSASRSTTPSRTIRERGTATTPSRSSTPSSRVSTPARSSTTTVRSNSGNSASRSASTSRTIRE